MTKTYDDALKARFKDCTGGSMSTNIRFETEDEYNERRFNDSLAERFMAPNDGGTLYFGIAMWFMFGIVPCGIALCFALLVASKLLGY